MRGELCVGVGSLLSLVSVLLMIFVHVGQINTSHVPRNVYMAKVNVSAYGDALSFAIAPDPVFGLYTDNASAPLQAAAGLRQIYKFGIYSHCGYLNDTAGRCGNKTIGDQFKPYDAITGDMSANWSIFTESFIPDSTFRDSKFLGHNSKAAYWMLLIGLLCAAAAFITGVAKHNMTFLVSTLFAIAGSLLLLIGASIWTVIIQRAANINDLPVHSHSGDQSVPLGIVVSLGPGLLLTWAAFACLVASVIPYMIRSVARFADDKLNPWPDQEEDDANE